MPPRRLRAAVRGAALLCASAALLPVALRASAATLPGDHFTVVSATKQVVDGPGNNVTKTIDYDVYVPDSATSATPQPAILETHGFGLSKTATEMTDSASYYARHGYVVLVYTSSGFGHSGGCIELDSVDWDVKDARQMLDVLAARPDVLHRLNPADGAVDPVVGMAGGSYGGGITELAAESDSRIRAIAASRTWNALQYSLLPNNLGTGYAYESLGDGVFKQQWSSLLFASGSSQPAMGNGGCPPVQVPPCSGFDPVLCTTYADVTAAGGADPAALAVVARSSPATFIDKLRVPTLLTQGESDTLFNLDDAAATYTELRSRSVPAELVWNWGGHGGYNSQPGEGEFYDGVSRVPDADYLPQVTLAWFDHWLRGAAGDTGPGFRYFRDWVGYDQNGSAEPAYGTAAAFPADASRPLLLSATGSSGGDLVGTAPSASAATLIAPAAGVPASYSETSNFQAPGSTLPGGAPSPFPPLPPSDPPGEAVTFTSSAFSGDVVSAGIPTAHLRLAHSNGQDLFLFGKVFDVAPDGSAELIRRLVAPVRVPASAFASGAAAVDVKLLGFAHRFAAGHSVRLVLASTDQAYLNGRIPDVISVATGGADPSSFSLPVDAGSAAAVTSTSSGQSGNGAKSSLAAVPNTSAAGGTGGTAAAGGAVLSLVAAAVVRRRRRSLG